MNGQPEAVALRVVTVCTMNICRSPAMEAVLGRTFIGTPELTIHVSSAGTDAEPGIARCGLSQALIGVDEPTGRAQLLSADVIADADLIFTADSGHRRQIALRNPTALSRTFTLTEAARLASWVVGPDGTLRFARAEAAGRSRPSEPNDLRVPTEALPADSWGRMRWLIAEMNSARGLIPRATNHFGYLRVDAIGPDDIPDPHVLGYGLHQQTNAVIVAAVAAWVDAAASVASS